MFSQSLRALEGDHGRLGAVFLFVGCSLLVAWGLWFTHGEITLYASTDTARVEVSGEPYAVRAPVEGAVVFTDLELGREVNKGDVLVALDTSEMRYRLSELRAGQAGLEQRIEDVRRELRVERKALAESRLAVATSEAEGAALVALARSRAGLAESELERLNRVFEDGLVAEAELRRARARAEQDHAREQATRRQQETDSHERSIARLEHETRVAELESRLNELASELERTGARIATVENEQALRELRAPIAGRVADVLSVRPGGYLSRGASVASIVPPGETRIVAEFDEAQAMGRVRSGQRASMKLDGFPWTQYGTLPIHVHRVGTEPRSGVVRVELSIAEPAMFPVPIEHGLPGSVEIEVDTLSPYALVLRAAGRRLSNARRSPRP